MSITEVLTSVVIVYWFARLLLPVLEEHERVKEAMRRGLRP